MVAFFVHRQINPTPAIAHLKTYSFLGVAAFLTVAALKFVHFYVPSKLGYAFLALVLVKFGAVVLIFPELIDKDPGLGKAELLGFLVPYFLFLFAEAAIVIKWLNKN